MRLHTIADSRTVSYKHLPNLLYTFAAIKTYGLKALAGVWTVYSIATVHI